MSESSTSFLTCSGAKTAFGQGTEVGQLHRTLGCSTSKNHRGQCNTLTTSCSLAQLASELVPGAEASLRRRSRHERRRPEASATSDELQSSPIYFSLWMFPLPNFGG